VADFGLRGVHVRRFRSLKDTSFRPGAISAIVGEPSTGKSNLLTAIWALLDPEAAPLSAADVAQDDEGPIRIVGELADGSSISVGGEPPDGSAADGSHRPPAVFFPAELRDGALVAPPGPRAHAQRVVEIMDDAVARIDREEAWSDPAGEAAPAHGLVAGLGSWREAGITGTVLLMEEPELSVPAPQARRIRWEPGALLHALAGVPERRPA
jgi:ABC-type dipeptide/oligopeptide/nickel transport system ATPase component